MCQYSLEGYASRKAVVGESLVTASLGDHGTIGMISPGKPDELVCVPPGSRLKITGVLKNLASELAISPDDHATFVSGGSTDTYVDSLVFDHHRGYARRPILLQEILAGMEVTVVSIPVENAAMAPDTQKVHERALEPA